LNVLIAACAQTEAFKHREDAIELVQKFVTLAQTLENSKAVAFSFGATDGVEVAASAAEEKVCASRYPSPDLTSSPLELPTSKHVREDILHPLLIALLAFKLGGPVNAAFTTHQREWRPPNNATRDALGFHSEGDVGDMFDDLRITVVWEMRNDKATGPSGSHNVFLTSDAMPRPLEALRTRDQDKVSTPTAILLRLR
jgi:hypothetical protein